MARVVTFLLFSSCAGFVGLFVKMDQRVFHGADWSSHLSPLLSLAVHGMGQPTLAQDGGPVAQLRGHSLELYRQSRDPPAAHQNHPAQAVQERQLVPHYQVSGTSSGSTAAR